MFERYSFVAITTKDLSAARRFWVEQLGFRVTEESPSEFFIVDAGGLRLCVDGPDDEIHFTGSTDPVVGLKVRSLAETLRMLKGRGIRENADQASSDKHRYAIIHDPDGRAVVLTEAD
jgi:catechol 2,3-dioxygenase-like lactoylglutathione lyase family enzyme